MQADPHTHMSKRKGVRDEICGSAIVMKMNTHPSAAATVPALHRSHIRTELPP